MALVERKAGPRRAYSHLYTSTRNTHTHTHTCYRWLVLFLFCIEKNERIPLLSTMIFAPQQGHVPSSNLVEPGRRAQTQFGGCARRPDLP